MMRGIRRIGLTGQAAGVVIGEIGDDAAPVGALRHQAARIANIGRGAHVGRDLLNDLDQNDISYTFNSSGQLVTLQYRDGYTQTLTWSAGQNTSVTDSFGRSINDGFYDWRRLPSFFEKILLERSVD